MCAGAIGWSQASGLVYGACDEQKGYRQVSGQLLHSKTQVISGILEKECHEILVKFFKARR